MPDITGWQKSQRKLLHDQSELLLVRVQLGSGTVLNDLEDQLDNRHFHIVFICLIFFLMHKTRQIVALEIYITNLSVPKELTTTQLK